MRRASGVVIVVILLVVIAAIVTFTQFRIGSTEEPGRVETKVANGAKHLLVRWNSRKGIPPPPADAQAAVEEGDKLFGAECAACHGLDGQHPTDPGRWMYPRAANLVSAGVQRYSDRELFWIVKNGIRFSGMPAFGPVESDGHIWSIVRYLRTLPKNASS